ncbi:CG9870, partial [Drosophila busckii]
VQLPTYYEIPRVKQALDKHTDETFRQSVTSLVVILTTFSGIVLSRILTHRLCMRRSLAYILEFALIVVPGTLFVTVAYPYSVHFVVFMVLLLIVYIWCTRALTYARNRDLFDLGTRPAFLTVLRALTHLITAICILAIDFECFHRPYRKSKNYGAQLMDTGIGLFVATMAMVSRRSRNFSDLRRSLLRSALPLILLGCARTLSITIIGYGQDDHEYGKHLNAFFILGLTKLLGSVISYFAHNDMQLLPFSLVLLIVHQMGLSFADNAAYVMDEDIDRSSWLNANREGLYALPGFVVIYLFFIYFMRWLLSNTLLSYAEMLKKLRQLLSFALLSWALTLVSVYTVGVSRVTCNLGYVMWMLAIVITMLLLSLFVFDFIINSVVPTEYNPIECVEKGVKVTEESGEKSVWFIICEALNMNGLTFFLLANLLTGFVNIFLKPEERSDSVSLLILLVYMFVATCVVYHLFSKRIRLA